MTWQPGTSGNAGGLTAAAARMIEAQRGAAIATLPPALKTLLALLESKDEKIRLGAASTLARVCAPMLAPPKDRSDTDREARAGDAHLAVLTKRAASRRVIQANGDDAVAVDVQVVSTLHEGANIQ